MMRHGRRHSGSDLKLKMDGGNRMRNDSGCFDDDCGSLSSNGSSHGSLNQQPDFLSAHWDEVVAQWAGKNHSIVAQEAVRMKAATEARRAELAETSSGKERARIAQRWRDDVADIMATTQDLIQCVANDVSEVSLNPRDPEAECGTSSMDLGKIIEEELQLAEGNSSVCGNAGSQNSSCLGDDEESAVGGGGMYLVRTRRKRRQRRRSSCKMTQQPNKRRDSGEIEMGDGSFLRSEQTFTIQVDRVEQMVRSGSWLWQRADTPTNKDSNNWDEIVLTDDANNVEGIYSDLIGGLKNKSEDIGDLFWSISLEEDQQQQAVPEDRCELLEGAKRRGRRFKAVRPRRTYWNIFAEWRKIFREEGDYDDDDVIVVKKRRPRRRGIRRKPSASSSEASSNRRNRNNRRHHHHYKKRRASLGAEDFFHDCLAWFKEASKSSRRRSFEGPMNKDAKRIKLASGEEGQLIRVRTKSTLERLTKSIERKIREAFVASDAEASLEEAAEAVTGPNPRAEDMAEWPKAVARRLRKSRRRFEKLRQKVRKLRCDRRRSYERRQLEMMEAFAEWSWNLDEGERRPEIEDVFQDWRQSVMEYNKETNCNNSVVLAEKKAMSRRKFIQFERMRPASKRSCCGRKANLATVRPRAAKRQLRRGVKGSAKQPRQRGFESAARGRE